MGKGRRDGGLSAVAKSIDPQREARDYSRRLINDADDTPPIRIIRSTLPPRPAECFVERSVCHSCFIFIRIITDLHGSGNYTLKAFDICNIRVADNFDGLFFNISV